MHKAPDTHPGGNRGLLQPRHALSKSHKALRNEARGAITQKATAAPRFSPGHQALQPVDSGNLHKCGTSVS